MTRAEANDSSAVNGGEVNLLWQVESLVPYTDTRGATKACDPYLPCDP